MMEYTAPGACIRLQHDLLLFSGNLEISDYTDLDAFFRQVETTLPGGHCRMDLTRLEYLNSSGVRSLATFVLGSAKTFEIALNPDLTWQIEQIPLLQRLKTHGVTLVPPVA